MTPFTQEQFTAAQKAGLETMFGLTQKAFEGVEKLVELNLQVARTALAEAADSAQAAVAVKDIQGLLSLQASMLQPTADKLAAYSRHVYDIVSGTGAEFSRAAEGAISEGQKTAMSLVDNALRNAPAGTEPAAAAMRTAMTAAQNAMEGVQRATRQAAEIAQSNFQTVAANVVSTGRQATAKAARSI